MMKIVDLRLAGFPIGTMPAFALERLINPLVDLSALPAPSQVTSVQVLPAAVLLTASGSQKVALSGNGAAHLHNPVSEDSGL
ncbi:MAG: hypothetical protein H0W40_12320 [Methylibium sp.]|uniref:hypothetical protein n=1 Tax=Methylibium sp. TaxID=2067992 RepID=UPI0017CBF433|nr:hypothetical protein [Methylibium sp.]MBA3598143.1 hypothetical protein [Methylibium sp.]